MILYLTMEPFIILWLGTKYVLTKTTLILLVANFFLYQIGSTVQRFKNAYGLYQDTWAAATEAILNLGISLICGSFWGIDGIIVGTLVSLFFMVVLWKPYFLYKNGFQKSVWLYWKGVLPLVMVFAISALIVNFISEYYVYDRESSNFIDWLIYATTITSIVSGIYGTFMYFIIAGFKAFIQRMRSLILKKLGR